MIVENKYTVKLSEIDKNNMATNKAILSYLEDTGGKHSNIVGYGILDIPKTNLTWVVLGWKLQVIRRPIYTEEISVRTWSRQSVRCYAYRDFEIYDENGNIIAIATSKWVMVDIRNGKIVRNNLEINEKYKPEENKFVFGDMDEFPKIQIPTDHLTETEYTVKRSDIDVNNHMHNLNYLDLANEVLPDEIYNNCEINNVKITYKKEIKLGEVVKCEYCFTNRNHVVVAKSKDGESVHALIELW